jgi:peptidoglycan/xylan/chitin deacetylase (PgdA/CDA1 family)
VVASDQMQHHGSGRMSARTRFSRRVKDAIGRVAGMSGVYARHFSSRMTVVAFHRVTDELAEDDLTCGSRKFENFCRFFQRHFRVLPFSEQVARSQAGEDLGGTLSITFDDGYLDNFEIAAPILLRRRLPATFFITTGLIGSQVIAPWDQCLPRQPGWMSWDHVRSLASSGFEIGNHTDTHIDMGTADPDTVRAELAVSRRKLAEALGNSTNLFAYPFGGREHMSSRSRELVREAGFVCCASCYGGTNAAAPDPFNLNRVGIAQWFATPDQLGFELVTGKA